MPISPITPAPVVPAPTGIKSVQRGVINIVGGAGPTITAAIAAVNTAKAEIELLGVTLTGSTGTAAATVELTNANTVTAILGSTNPSFATVIRFQVTEWN